MPAPRLFLLLLAGGLLHPANVAGQTAPPRQVMINRGRVPDATLARLEAGTTTRIPAGRYWYDRVSGAWGLEGGHTRGLTTAGLELGGRLPADISGGGTGVFINGGRSTRWTSPRCSSWWVRWFPVGTGWTARAMRGSSADRRSPT